MVVLPDYQGIGIGMAFENYTSKHYADMGWNVNITTTTPALVHALRRDPNWILFRADRCKSTWANYKKSNTSVGNARAAMERLVKSKSNNRITYSFNWKRDKKK